MTDSMDLQDDTSFFKKKFHIDFFDSSTQHDRVLIVQDIKFYVNSMHLSMFSDYFYGLFNFQEKEKKEIELKEVDSSEFETFLKMLYPLDVKVTSNNLHMLIGLSKKFLTPFIYQKCFEFVEDTININKFKLKEIFSLMGIINSETLKNCCTALFNVDQLARFLEVAEEYNFLALKEHIIDKICTPEKDEIALSRNLVEILLENDFTKFEEISVNYWSSFDDLDNIMPLYIIITLMKYDIPKLEKWTAANFGRFLMHPNSRTAEYIELLTESLSNMSSKHKTVIVKTLFLLNDFPSQLNSLAIEEAYDTYLMRSFNRTNNFSSIEFVVRKNFVQTKNVIRKYLQNTNFESINNREQLRNFVKSSHKVQRFVYDCLPQNESKTEFMNYFLG